MRLPPLRVTSARVDHTKTKTWGVEKKTWLPGTGGNPSVFRAAAIHHAQQRIETTASSSQHLELFKAQAELLIGKMYEAVRELGMAATVLWIVFWVPRSRLCVAVSSLRPKHGHAKP